MGGADKRMKHMGAPNQADESGAGPHDQNLLLTRVPIQCREIACAGILHTLMDHAPLDTWIYSSNKVVLLGDLYCPRVMPVRDLPSLSNTNKLSS